MSDKVIGGTPKGFQSMCTTCRNAVNLTGLNCQQVSYCQALGRRVTFPINTCSVYSDKRMPSLYDMEQIAWSIQSRNRGPVGFETGGKFEVEITPPAHPPSTPPPPAQPCAKVPKP